MQTERCTLAQAVIRFLKNQYVERDGTETRFLGGCFGIFGHGNVAGIGQALQENPDFRYYQTRNEQAAVHTAAAYAKMKNRLSTLAREGESVPAASKVNAYIAALSEKEPPAPTADDKKKAAAGGGKPAKAKPTFDIPAFLADLSLYITGRSGIVFDFDLSPAEVQRLTTDPAATVTVDSKVSHIELLFVRTPPLNICFWTRSP